MADYTMDTSTGTTMGETHREPTIDAHGTVSDIVKFGGPRLPSNVGVSFGALTRGQPPAFAESLMHASVTEMLVGAGAAAVTAADESAREQALERLVHCLILVMLAGWGAINQLVADGPQLDPEEEGRTAENVAKWLVRSSGIPINRMVQLVLALSARGPLLFAERINARGILRGNSLEDVMTQLHVAVPDGQSRACEFDSLPPNKRARRAV